MMPEVPREMKTKGVILVRKKHTCRECGKGVPPHRLRYCSGMCKLKYESKHRKKK